VPPGNSLKFQASGKLFATGDLYTFVSLESKMRKEKLHKAGMIIGSVLALAIVFSQYLTALSVSETQKAKTEQAGTTSGDEKASYISLPSFSIPAPVSVQVNLDACCLFEIFFEEDIDENYVAEDISYVDKFFQTMFRVIISPNAP
jgi:hypothetical protein